MIQYKLLYLPTAEYVKIGYGSTHDALFSFCELPQINRDKLMLDHSVIGGPPYVNSIPLPEHAAPWHLFEIVEAKTQ